MEYILYIIYLICYMIMVLAVYAFDAYVGFGSDIPNTVHNSDGPPISFYAWLWPLTLPFLITLFFFYKLDNVRNTRLEKEETKKRIRIAAQKELEKEMLNLEHELIPIQNRNVKY